MSDFQALKVAILWHMHQPNYREPGSNRLSMPWVRLHALKDYLDMPLAATRHENVRVTFNLVPTLLDQLQLYIDGGTDRHLDLSRLPAETLSQPERLEILQTFFVANPERMIQPHSRFWELYRKRATAVSEPATLANLFSSTEIRDLQVWSNLAWIDPLFRTEEPVKRLFATGRHFTEEDKAALLDWQIELIGRIVPTYRRLMDEGRLDLSFTPYHHPILPLLCDTNAAREALPSIDLPARRFAHPEDARRQIKMATERYENLFARPMQGMWPSEGSVSEEVLELAAELGVKWMATDEEILFHSLAKSQLPAGNCPHHYLYAHPCGVNLFFRDHALSDRIGFVYSSWKADRAVADFISHLKRLRKHHRDHLDEVVVPVILDGENAWEYFPDDGTEFLTLLYDRLADDPELETVGFSEAAERLPARPLPKIFAGSWINHNFRIWIGHVEDNAAWDLLSQTRDDLVAFETAHPDFDPECLISAWRQIDIAEGSDWCWWYGDEHRGPHNEAFDQVFRRHLAAVYENLGLAVPIAHALPIYRSKDELQAAMPDALVSPKIDGRLTHFYEWAGAGFLDRNSEGGAMHQVERSISGLYFAYDYERFYIRLDFTSKKLLDSLVDPVVRVKLAADSERELDLEIGRGKGRGDGYQFACVDRVEIAVERQALWSEGHGRLELSVALFQTDQLLEKWPELVPVAVDVPPRYQEMFWPN